MVKKQLIITVVIALIVGVAAFFGGVYYQRSQGRAAFSGLRGQFTAGQFGPTGRGRFGNAGGLVRGQIISNDNNSITVKMSDGSSKIVWLSGNTAILEATAAAKTALANGKTVMVSGTANADGSITAQNIQLNPQQLRSPNPAAQ